MAKNLDDRHFYQLNLHPAHLAELIDLQSLKQITPAVARAVLTDLMAVPPPPDVQALVLQLPLGQDHAPPGAYSADSADSGDSADANAGAGAGAEPVDPPSSARPAGEEPSTSYGHAGHPILDLLKARNLLLLDRAELENLCHTVVQDLAGMVAQGHKKGSVEKVVPRLVGEVMKRARGRADPEATKELLGALVQTDPSAKADA